MSTNFFKKGLEQRANRNRSLKEQFKKQVIGKKIKSVEFSYGGINDLCIDSIVLDNGSRVSFSGSARKGIVDVWIDLMEEI